MLIKQAPDYNKETNYVHGNISLIVVFALIHYHK